MLPARLKAQSRAQLKQLGLRCCERPIFSAAVIFTQHVFLTRMNGHTLSGHVRARGTQKSEGLPLISCVGTELGLKPNMCHLLNV